MFFMSFRDWFGFEIRFADAWNVSFYGGFNISLLSQLFVSKTSWKFVARRKSASLENANRLRVVTDKQRIEWWHLISQWRNPHHSTLNGKTNLSWMKFFGTTNDSWCFMNIYRSEGNYHIFPHFTMKQLFRRHLLIFRRLNDKNFAKTLLWSEKRHVE
jgi:hypothetical protein